MSEEEKKPHILLRILKKILKWIVLIAIMIGFTIFYSKYRSGKIKEFYLQTWSETKLTCKGDMKCLENAKAHFKECFDNYHYTEKKGKFNTEDMIDMDGLLSCLNETLEESPEQNK